MNISTLFIVLLSSLFSIEFKSGDAFCFENIDPDIKIKNPKPRDLFRGQLNKTSKLLSGEALRAKTGSGESIREIVIFEFDSSYNRGLELRKYSGTERYTKHSGYYLQWSRAKNNSFTYIHNNGTKYQLRYSFYSIRDQIFKKMKPLNKDPNTFNNVFTPEYITDYTSIIDYGEAKAKDGYFVSYLSNNQIILSTNHSDFSYRSNFFESSKSKLLNNPQTLDIFYNNGEYDAIISFKGDSTEQDLHYFCSFHLDPISYENRQITLYPKDISINPPYGYQMQGSFSHTGEYVAFLNQRINTSEDAVIGDKKDVFDLYTFKIDSRENLCLSSYEENISNRLDDYKQIDTNLENFHDMQLDELGLDYAWHPTENIIFYVNMLTLNNSTKVYSLRYYNLDSDSGPIELLSSNGTLAYPSISPDGKYVVFSFFGAPNGIDFKNCDGCCMDADAYRIGVIELIQM